MNGARTKLTLGVVAVAFLAFSGVAQAATISFAEAMTVMARDCGKDVSKYCKGVPLANNGVGKCLIQNQAKVTPVCIATLAVVTTSLQDRLAAQQAALKVCRGDASRRCQGVVQSDGHILECLLKAANTVSKKCNAAITNAGWR